MDPRHADLGCVQDIIQRPQRRSSRIANARGAMARVAIGLSQDILKAFLECRIYIRVKRRKVASNGRFSHQVLQKTTIARAERTTIMVLRDPLSAYQRSE